MKQIVRTNDLKLFKKLKSEENKENSSFLQSAQYGEMQKNLGAEPWYLVLEEGNTPKKAWLFVQFNAKRGRFLFCPYGVFTDEELNLITKFLKTESKKHKIDFIRISPLHQKDDEILSKFKELNYKDAPVHLMHPELVWMLDLTPSEEEILAQMRKNTRYYVKRAEKDGVTIERGNSQELLDKFWEIHHETAKRHNFISHSKKYLDEQLKQFAPTNEIEVILGIYQGKPISGAVIMYYGNEGVYHHGASLAEYNKIPASYLIQWEAIKESKKRGKQIYNLFGIVENAPKHPWAGLSFFKQGFGGSGKYLIHVQDLPTSWKYPLNYAVEKLRKIKRGY